MSLQDIFVGAAIAIIIFIFIVFLVIFAPKSQNFFKRIDPVLDGLGKETDLMRETFVKLGIVLNDDNLNDEYKQYYDTVDVKPLEWLPWLDDKAEGKVEYLPIYLFSKIDNANFSIFNKLFSTISKSRDIRSVFFLKLGVNSRLVKHKGWAELTNDTLRYIYCFNSFCYQEDECGIWVNGEAKKMFKDYHYFFDASKEHSLYNNTFEEVIFLVVDFVRPKEITKGYSDNFLHLGTPEASAEPVAHQE